MERAFRRAESDCERPGDVTCPVEGLEGQYECVGVMSNLERCGGCVADGVGQDCTVIPGALDVECVQGGCAVSSCLPGYEFTEGECFPLVTFTA